MHFYMSGTPRNDVYQRQENELCSHRLFSLHGDYQRAVHKWLDDVIAAPEHPYPKFIMLDSGAFTAWNAGGEVTLDEVFDSYARFEEKAGDLFEKIWMINLDKIPGERGRDPTPQEINEALQISDVNYKRLVDRFGERILPVFHQGEDMERCFELADLARYICISPRNDLPEKKRADWSLDRHKELRAVHPDIMTHGLATTGNIMLKEVSWTSVDSAAWVLHAGFGKVDIFRPGTSFEQGRYQNFFVSDDFRKTGLVRQHIGGTAKYEDETGIASASVEADDFDANGRRSIATMAPETRREILSVVESYGFDLEMIQKNSRARSIVCMGELAKYCRWATEFKVDRRTPGSLGTYD